MKRVSVAAAMLHLHRLARRGRLGLGEGLSGCWVVKLKQDFKLGSGGRFEYNWLHCILSTTHEVDDCIGVGDDDNDTDDERMEIGIGSNPITRASIHPTKLVLLCSIHR